MEIVQVDFKLDFEAAGKYSFYLLLGDCFNIEAVCPYYLPDSQCSFTWRRDSSGYAIVSGYDPEDDPDVHWLCWCGEFVTDGSDRCPNCNSEAPWGAESDGDDYDPDLDFGEFEPDYEAYYEENNER